MNNSDDKRKTTYRYGLASAGSRLGSKFLDLVLLFLILLGIFYWMFSGDESIIPSWKIFVFSLVTFIIFFIYFVIIPFFAGGYTLFSKIFKIRIYSIYLKTIVHSKWIKNLNFRFMWQLMIRELFLWEISAFIFLILGIIAFAWDKQASDFIKVLLSVSKLTNSETDYPSEMNMIIILFSAFFSVSCLITLFIIINVVFTSRKRSFHDSISNTVVIKMTDVHSDEKRPTLSIKSRPKIQYDLPGEIPVDSLLDIIEEN